MQYKQDSIQKQKLVDNSKAMIEQKRSLLTRLENENK